MPGCLCVLWAMLIRWAGMKLWIWIKNLEWVGGIGAKGKGGMCGLGAFMPFFSLEEDLVASFCNANSGIEAILFAALGWIPYF